MAPPRCAGDLLHSRAAHSSQNRKMWSAQPEPEAMLVAPWPIARLLIIYMNFACPIHPETPSWVACARWRTAMQPAVAPPLPTHIHTVWTNASPLNCCAFFNDAKKTISDVPAEPKALSLPSNTSPPTNFSHIKDKGFVPPPTRQHP